MVGSVGTETGYGPGSGPGPRQATDRGRGREWGWGIGTESWRGDKTEIGDEAKEGQHGVTRPGSFHSFTFFVPHPTHPYSLPLSLSPSLPPSLPPSLSTSLSPSLPLSLSPCLPPTLSASAGTSKWDGCMRLQRSEAPSAFTPTSVCTSLRPGAKPSTPHPSPFTPQPLAHKT